MNKAHLLYKVSLVLICLSSIPLAGYMVAETAQIILGGK